MPISLVLADITHVAADAIVNAANSQLLPGAGVCGAIHAAAGPELARECAEHVRRHGPVAAGDAAITRGYALPARFVIHAVGPVWRGGGHGEASTLASAYRASVRLAEAAHCAAIALPSLSTGVFGYPVARAAPVAIAAVREGLAECEHLGEATFVLFDRATYAAYTEALTQSV